MNARETLKINEKGHLEIGGADCAELAARFKTPLYVLDERHIRTMMAVYRDTLAREYKGESLVLYASKAFSALAIYAIAKEERIGADVVSGGELYTALRAGFPPEKICMHGNNKLPEELCAALDSGVGLIVVDSKREADLIERLAEERGKTQDVLLRVNPGIEAHTHAYIRTAMPDSKFGFSVADGSAAEMTGFLLRKNRLRLRGFHCHIGSQIFEKKSFVLAAEACLDFCAAMRKTFGFEADTLNLGGGFGIWYNDEDPKLSPGDYADHLRALINAVEEGCKRRKLRLPRLMIEPGRSVVGEAGITLYTAGAVKRAGPRTYVAVDGGMFENPRYCLYGARYTAILAERAAEPPTALYALAGKCCESGDLIGTEMNLPEVREGDLIAVLSTGAYNYSMASNYNRNLVPPVVLVKDGRARYIVKPQTYEDLIRNDLLPQDP